MVYTSHQNARVYADLQSPPKDVITMLLFLCGKHVSYRNSCCVKHSAERVWERCFTQDEVTTDGNAIGIGSGQVYVDFIFSPELLAYYTWGETWGNIMTALTGSLPLMSRPIPHDFSVCLRALKILEYSRERLRSTFSYGSIRGQGRAAA
jgi:hypothetical protein